MIVLGVNGGLDRADEARFVKAGIHDASAAIVRDGELLAAVEQERFDRVKHSGKLPVDAMRYCLRTAGAQVSDVDRFVFNVLERDLDYTVDAAYRKGLIPGYRRGRAFVQQLFEREFGASVDPARFEFIDHHYAHALSAFVPSGFERSLVVTLDGMGSGHSGSAWLGRDGRLAHVGNYDGSVAATTQSLGHLYLAVTCYLGFKAFDEYKVMGLAPYGDPARFEELLAPCATLCPDGDYRVHLSALDALRELGPPRTPEQAITQVHMDVAAALQGLLEKVALHVLGGLARSTGERRLCLAGGVAHNCAFNGRLLREGLFDEVFVQPAAHDGGLALGGAWHGHAAAVDGGAARRSSAPVPHVYLGPACGADDEIEQELRRWRACLHYERLHGDDARVARLLAQGGIVGWVQGRAEFGPRALGNRSIVADPRPAAHKDVINAMVKKREAFRPFAPSVLEEAADEYFELPPGYTRLPFMVFVVKVRERYRSLLGAVCHVDGTARVQTVARHDNERYWRLIKAFGNETGLPMLLNTSFNNNAEPIVTTTEDAVVCYLTTGLPTLVVGDFLVSKRPVDRDVYRRFRPALPPHVLLRQGREGAPAEASSPGAGHLFEDLFHGLYRQRPDPAHFLGDTHGARKTPISSGMAAMLAAADGFMTIGQLMERAPDGDRDALLDETLALWAGRRVQLRPAS